MIQSLYQKIKATNENPSWVLSTGSWGVWPDPARLDRGTKKNAGAGEFARLYVQGWQAPVQTLFVPGAHEDHHWLRARYKAGNLEVMNNVHCLMNGYMTYIGDWDTKIRVTGFGKVFSESTFNGKFNKKSHRHYTRNEFERACSSGPTDILLCHEFPNTLMKRIIFATRPKLIVYSSRTPMNNPTEIMGTMAVGLQKGEIYSIVL